MSHTLAASWIDGKYNIAGIEASISCAFSFVSIGDFSAQGREADNIISEIHKIWTNGDMTQEEAVSQWMDFTGFEF